MATATAITGGVNAGLSIWQTIDGANREKKAQEALDNYKRQELSNPNANLQASTMGADVMREELQRNNATAFNSMQSAGARGMLAGLPAVLQNNNTISQQIGANLDQQNANNMQLEAQGNAMVQQMREQREIGDLAGLGAERNAGIQQKWNGLENTAQSLGATAMATGQMNYLDHGSFGFGSGQRQVTPYSGAVKGSVYSQFYNPYINPISAKYIGITPFQYNSNTKAD